MTVGHFGAGIQTHPTPWHHFEAEVDNEAEVQEEARVEDQEAAHVEAHVVEGHAVHHEVARVEEEAREAALEDEVDEVEAIRVNSLEAVSGQEEGIRSLTVNE